MTDDTNIVFLRDITAGTLIIVLSLFFFYGAWMLSDYVAIWQFVSLLLAAKLGWFIMRVGFYMVRGLHVDIT